MNILFRFLFLSALCISVWAPTSQAQQNLTTKEVEQSIQNNGIYALMVMTEQHLKAALITGTEFLNFSADIDFKIVVCGGIVKEISTNEVLKSVINQHIDKGISVLMCGLTLKNLKLDASTMPEKAEITQNGITYFFGLQELGYKTLSL
jgi:intracellular sulfur oxidation DsrE/DsrF family protein